MSNPCRPTTGLLLAVSVLAASAAWANPFRNIDNDPFASRCDGPQGAVVIARDAPVGAAQAVASAVRAQHDERRLRHAAATMRRVQGLGLHDARARVRLPRLAVHTRGGRLVLPDLVRAAQSGELGSPANQLTFRYEGWSASEEAALRSYLATAYPKARLVYGPPAFNITVSIIRDDSITDLQGGIYDATANEIRMPRLTGNVPEDTFILMMLVLRAFRDDVALFYDAWEEGMVGAAATAVQVQPGVSPDFDPKDPGPFYALSVYEPQNHPELGSPTFYPEGNFGGMLVWRIAMARAAWMKCWIEDDDFFARFNEQYYREFREGLGGDVPALREVAATVLPTVEGLPFQEWFVRQHVLDTSVRAGLKEYTWNIPLDNAVVLICEHYLTDEEGSEWVRGGQARTVYWSFDFSVNLYAEEGNLIDIPTGGDTPGEGFLIPTFFNIGGAQRITVQLDLNGLRSYYPFPYGVRGFDPGQNNLYGGILNQAAGKMNVEGGSGISDLTVRRGVWGGIIASPELRPLTLSVTFTNPDGQDMTRRVNVGWDSYCIFLDGGRQTTATRTFLQGATGLHMISLPLTPTTGSAAGVLGIPPEDLLLARWRPELPPEGRYEVWPDCEPFAPGRGFWLRVLDDLGLTVTGVVPSAAERIFVPLDLGWNMFGSVRLEAVPLDGLKVQVGTDPPLLLSEAVSRRYVQTGVFQFSEATGYEPADTLEPFKGYWIRVLTPGGCRLVFEPLQTASAAVAGRAGAAGPQPDWTLAVVAQAGSSQATARLGAAAGATSGGDTRHDMAAPPRFAPGVALQLIKPTRQGDQALLADIRPGDGVGERWELVVSSALPGQPVRVSWPDLSDLPDHLRPILLDPATGKRLYMRTTPGYTIPAGEEGVQRRLTIEMAGAQAQGLTVSALAARPAGDGVSLVYTLSRDAAVRARVLNIAGRPVRVILNDQVAPAGANTVVWNLASQQGAKVPSGLYLFEVEARSEDGQSVRGIHPFRVVRP